MAPVTAPTTEIGYTQAPSYNWWLYENETTPELIWPQSIYVFDQMRRTDSQVGSVLRAVTETLLRTPWRIDPAGARARVTKFVADDLGLPVVGKPTAPPPRLKDRFSWPTHLREALLMLPYGHAYFEQVYRVSPDGTAAHLRKLAYRPAKTIERVDVASDGGLVAIKQYWTQMDREPKPIPVNHLVAYIHAKEGGNWLGTSILRNCYKNWLLKDRLLRVQAQTVERNGMGIPLYKAQEGASGPDMAAGKAMATAWRAGEAAGSAVPFGADLVLRGVEGTLPDAQPAIDYHDSQIARAVLAHFLNLGAQTGSWALGTTFADFFTMSLQTLAEQIRDTATQHIVEDLVDINFGEDEPAPRLVFDEIGSRQAATAQALKTLVDAGVIRPDEVLEESSRQQYGLPPADLATARTPPAPTPSSDQVSALTQMGDMSVAAAMGDPKALAAGVADLDEEADDWEDAIDALVLALDEWDGYVAAAWDSAKHARNPKGSPGGGKFRSMVDRLKDAIDAHAKGGGKGDPFDGFDREQLRRTAKARGIELKRGESRDEIAKKLLDHLGANGGKPNGKPKEQAPKPSGDTAKISRLAGHLNSGGTLDRNDPVEAKLADAIGVWTTQENRAPGLKNIEQLREEVTAALEGRGKPDTHGALLVQLVRLSPPEAPVLHRGMSNVDPSVLPEVGGTFTSQAYRRGRRAGLSFSSFTTDGKLAKNFSTPLGRDGVSVEITVKAGSRSLRIDKQAGDRFERQQEWLGAGDFKVTKRSERTVKDPWSHVVVVLELEQVGDIQAAAGMDTHPGGEQLKHYWVHGEGAAKWSTWTELYHHLVKYLNPEMAKRTAAEWFHERFGDWPGSDTNKVRHGKPPRGHLVGPG